MQGNRLQLREGNLHGTQNPVRARKRVQGKGRQVVQGKARQVDVEADQKAAGEAEVQAMEGEEKVWRIIISVILQ